MHPLLVALQRAASGHFPDIDGVVEIHPPDDHGTHACVEFTGHSFVLTDRPDHDVRRHGADGFGGATQPDLLRWLAGPEGEIGSHDAVLVARGTGDDRRARSLSLRDDLEWHARVARARRHRRDVMVFGDERGLVTLGTGLVDRLEMSVEVFTAATTGVGSGRRLIEAGLAWVPAGTPVWAQVASGNAASLRAFLRAGFVPIGAEVLLHPVVPRDES